MIILANFSKLLVEGLDNGEKAVWEVIRIIQLALGGWEGYFWMKMRIDTSASVAGVVLWWVVNQIASEATIADNYENSRRSDMFTRIIATVQRARSKTFDIKFSESQETIQ